MRRSSYLGILLILVVLASRSPLHEPIFPVVSACNICDFQLAWGSYGSGAGQFFNPRGVAVDSDGNVYVTDTENDRVVKFTGDGTLIGAWGCTSAVSNSCNNNHFFDNPYAIAVDLSGNMYVMDEGNRIDKLDHSGNVLQFGSHGSGIGQFDNSGQSGGVAVDPSGIIYAVDNGNNRVEKFTSAGIYLTQWEAQYGPNGIVVDSSGNVYVTATLSNDVLKFTGNGIYITQWGSKGFGAGQFDIPEDVAVDSLGNVYVTDIGSNRVQKFDGSGSFLADWGSFGTGNGQFRDIWGIAVDRSGNVFVADKANDRIQKFGDENPTVSLNYTVPRDPFFYLSVMMIIALMAILFYFRRKAKSDRRATQGKDTIDEVQKY